MHKQKKRCNKKGVKMRGVHHFEKHLHQKEKERKKERRRNGRAAL